MGLIERLKSALHVPSRREMEIDYLNQASSRIDLEMRQREVDRGKFRQFSRNY